MLVNKYSELHLTVYGCQLAATRFGGGSRLIIIAVDVAESASFDITSR